jgi:hypothetical protein
LSIILLDIVHRTGALAPDHGETIAKWEEVNEVFFMQPEALYLKAEHYVAPNADEKKTPGRNFKEKYMNLRKDLTELPAWKE